jgi:hypothetical protein
MLLAARELAWIKGLQGDLAGMRADAWAVVQAAGDDRFVEMQGLAAVGYSADFLGAFAEAEAAQRRAAAIAREDEKSYRLTVVLAGIALCLALQGRVAETDALFEEAKASNPAYRESIVVELEATVRWIAGDFGAALALAQEAVAWQPRATSRRRAVGPAIGALAAIECGDVPAAERLVDRAKAAYGGRDWSFFLQVAHAAEGLLAWHAGSAADGVAVLRPAAAGLMRIQVRPWAAFVLLDLVEAAAEAGDAAAAAAAAADLQAVAALVELPLYRGMAAAAAAWAAWPGATASRPSRPRGRRSSCWPVPTAWPASAALTMPSGGPCPRTRARRPSPPSSRRRSCSAAAGATGAGSARSTP